MESFDLGENCLYFSDQKKHSNRDWVGLGTHTVLPAIIDLTGRADDGNSIFGLGLEKLRSLKR